MTLASDQRKGVFVAVAALVLSMLPSVAMAAPAATPTAGEPALWTASAAKPTASRGGHPRQVNPSDYRAYTLDADLLADILDDAPDEGSRAARSGGTVDLVVPAPTGELVHFAVVDSPVMEDELAAAHPDITTYAGTSITEGYPASIRLDVTPQGFHAAVRGDQASWYVDPAYRGDDSLYLSYFGSALPAPEKGLIEPELDHETHEKITQDAPRVGEGAGAEVKQRIYRLALLTDPSYAAYTAPGLNDGKQDVASNAAVLSAKVTLMNRVNQIYNDDLAIRMVLINGTDSLNLNTVAKASTGGGPCGSAACFVASGVGSLVEGCTSELLDRQHSVIGLLAGASNFDIGHLMLGLEGGGLAALGVVGRSDKAQGCTGVSTPVGDFMAVDYVSHELGHQFKGNHTFNGVNQNCAGGNRHGATSVEPGSGSSIMAYAGICATDDLQDHSDPYFSQRSQTEISAYVNASSVPVNEVQAVALRDFDGSDSFTLTFDGIMTAPITAGVNYNAAGIKAAVQAATGGTVTVRSVHGTSATPTFQGFQLAFGGTARNVPHAVLNVAGSGFSGFTSEIVQGGTDARGGNVIVTTSNNNPVVTAPAGTSIPTRTPFTLTGSAVDADDDAMTYLWEQNDHGVTVSGSTAGGIALTSENKINGPLFRQFGTFADVDGDDTLQINSPGENNAGGNPSRTFPDMAQILSGSTNAATGACVVGGAGRDCQSEYLPTNAYVGALASGNGEPSLNFRLTARDLHVDGGGTSYADAKVKIVPSTGPFQVTSQAAPQTYAGGSSQTIAWDVNGTNVPALAENVKITLSADGGESFNHVLAASTPNDGSQSVTIPDVGTTTARVKIEAVGNIFFDVNDAPLTITSTSMSLNSSVPDTITAQYSDAANASFSASTPTGSADLLIATPTGLPAGLTLTKTPTSATGVAPGTATFALTGTIAAAPGSYPVTISVTDGTETGIVDFTIVVSAENASAVYTGPSELATRSSGAVDVTLAATITPGGDGTPGDVTQADAIFVDTTTGETLCTTAADADGTAACVYAANMPASRTLAIEVRVGGSYTGVSAGTSPLLIPVTPSVPADTTPPDTAITSGPRDNSILLDTRTSFGFGATESPVTFDCRLDGKARACAGGAVALTGLPTGTHRFSVAARDGAANLDATAASRAFTVPVDDRALKGKGWKRKKAAGSFRQTYSQASKKGARLTYRVSRATSLSLVVGKGRKYGKVTVYLNGAKLRTVSLAGRSASKQIVHLKSFGKGKSGTVKIVSGSGRTVRIDGLAVVTAR